MLGRIRTAGGVIVEAKIGNDNGAEELKKDRRRPRCDRRRQMATGKFSRLRVEAETDVREEVYRLASERHWTLRELSQRKATLEDVFVEITHPDEV